MMARWPLPLLRLSWLQRPLRLLFRTTSECFEFTLSLCGPPTLLTLPVLGARLCAQHAGMQAFPRMATMEAYPRDTVGVEWLLRSVARAPLDVRCLVAVVCVMCACGHRLCLSAGRGNRGLGLARSPR